MVTKYTNSKEKILNNVYEMDVKNNGIASYDTCMFYDYDSIKILEESYQFWKENRNNIEVLENELLKYEKQSEKNIKELEKRKKAGITEKEGLMLFEKHLKNDIKRDFYYNIVNYINISLNIFFEGYNTFKGTKGAKQRLKEALQDICNNHKEELKRISKDYNKQKKRMTKKAPNSIIKNFIVLYNEIIWLNILTYTLKDILNKFDYFYSQLEEVKK